MRIILSALCLLGLLAGTGFASTLPESVTAALARAHIPLSSVGIVVRQVDADKPVVSLNAERPMNPASTMKLLTTYAALETLGPAYRWKTEAYLDGRLEDGVLQGNLVFKGYGDPKLTVEEFWMWLRELRQRGLREIRGDVVLDHSYFEAVDQDPAEFDHDPTRAYNVGTNALLLNFNALHLHLIPDGRATTALLEPALAGYTVRNRITTSAGLRCNGEDDYKARLDGHDIVLEGSIPANCGETDAYFSLLPQDEYFFAVFGGLWQELGGTLQGKLRSGTAPAGQAPFATYVSPPLSEVIRDINKFSNNIMARQVFLTLGAAGGADAARSADAFSNNEDRAVAQAYGEATPPAGQPGGDIIPQAVSAPLPVEATSAKAASPDAGPADGRGAGGNASASDTAGGAGIQPAANIARSISAMQHWLKAENLQFPELVMENGAGLSRKARVSAQHLAELLQRATGSPFFPELEASLPILGLDGTVKKRLKDSDIAGYAHLKTGSLDGVKSLAGYVKANSGKQWIVVFIVNHPNAALAQPAQDALIAWLQTGH